MRFDIVDMMFMTVSSDGVVDASTELLPFPISKKQRRINQHKEGCAPC